MAKIKNNYNEDTRVKLPATIQFMRLGYNYIPMNRPDYDPNTNIFIDIFKESIGKINRRDFTYEEIYGVIKEINKVIQNKDLGKEFYYWLINPVGRVKLIDFDNIDNNDFSIANEVMFGSESEPHFRPDVNIFINGIPLGFLEVKIPNNEGTIQEEFNRMLNKRLKERSLEKHFNMFQIVSFSNNMEYEDVADSAPAEDVKVGSFYSTPNGQKTFFSFFREEEKLKSIVEVSDSNIIEILKDNGYGESVLNAAEFQTNLKETTPCNSFITSLYSKERVMFFLQYGIMFIDSTSDANEKDKIPQKQKHIMRYPQFFACKKIVEKLESGEKSGIIWHTQGSGKTALAAFANRVITDYYANKNIVARFFFVVDRLDLLNQASEEFSNRGLSVTKVNNRREFSNELDRPITKKKDMTAFGEVCVVNIHKFSENMPSARNDYDANVQRIIFVDEAHRSYSLHGEFFKNLMLTDDNGVYIALTGTPLLSKRERSNLKFGDYIHKYFYDKSIADGYTLRIKKEQVDTVARVEINKNLELEYPDADPKSLYVSDGFVRDLGKYIVNDFENFRYVNNDNTIGSMIVCSSNPQAEKINDWINKNTKLTSKVVISNDIPGNSDNNKFIQKEFRDSTQPDILVVHLMLTTGYDVPRLKKMYLLRNAKDHTLLQTISRVNRPYRSENGKSYEYGYIVDFVDIRENYEATIEAYIKELEEEINENGEQEGSLRGLVVGPDDIYNRYLKYFANLNEIVSQIFNVELFSNEIRGIEKDKLYTLRRSINGIRNCYVEFKLSRATKYEKEIDDLHYKRLLKEVENRIRTLNMKSRPLDTIAILDNEDIISIVYEFIKTRIDIIDLGAFIGSFDGNNEDAGKTVKIIEDIQKEVRRNKNSTQLQFVLLNELLAKIFEQLDIANIEDLKDINSELYEAYLKLKEINDENERLSSVYGGQFAYVKSYQDYISDFPDQDVLRVEEMYVDLYSTVSETLSTNALIQRSRENFSTAIKKKAIPLLLKKKLYKELDLKNSFDIVLNQLYSNLLAYKEMEEIEK